MFCLPSRLSLPLSLVLSFFLISISFTGNSGAQQQSSPEQQRQRPAIITSPESQSSPPSPSKRDERAGQDDEVLRVETDLTNVLFTAIDKEKRFITTLRKEDVRVLENGQPQEIFTFERETDLPLSLAVLIDTSRSQERTLPEEKAAARAFIDSVLRPEKDHAAIIAFNGEAMLQQGLTGKPESLRAAIERVQVQLPPDDPECRQADNPNQDPRCWTSIWDSVWVTANDLLSQTPERTRRAAILLTDGEDTSSMTKRDEAIERALKANMVVYAIGIGDRKNFSVEEGPLRKIAERTGGRAFFPRDDADLSAAFAQIQQELRSQYLIAYSPSNKARDGSYRQINIEIVNPQLRKQKLRLLYRQGYYARQPAAGRTG